MSGNDSEKIRAGGKQMGPAEIQRTLAAFQEFVSKNKVEATKVVTTDQLQSLYRSYVARNVFLPGDLVTWKPGLKNRVHPAEGEPAVVVRVLDTPIIDGLADAGNPDFKAEYDLICGLSIDGVFLTYHYDSARFKKYESKTIAE